MLCIYCQGFNFRPMAAEVIANYRDPLPSPDYDNYGSYLFKYHSTILGLHSAIAEGCDLCSLFWETWLENSRNWVWFDLFSDDEESDQENKSADLKSAISNTPQLFRPSLSIRLEKLWLGPVRKDAGSKIENAQNNQDKREIDSRLFRYVVIGVHFGVKGDPKFPMPYLETGVTLGIYAKAGIEFQKRLEVLRKPVTNLQKVEDEAVSQGLITLRERSLNADFDIANQWLQKCLRNHVCGPGNAIPRLPTRVIDIGQSISDLRLLESKGLYAKYTALSHCWGTSPIWTTTIKNQRLPHHSQLPGNFQDAVTVTRMLGLQYLWIDSLCILQDSAEDWEIECANMANIYRNAEVTISVRDNTSSSSGGFLQDVGRKPFKSCQLNNGLMISNQQIDWPSKTNPIPFGGVDRRGWILQEKLLSRRLLHFSKEMMCWQCCHDTYFEGLHHPIPASVIAASRAEYVEKVALDQLGRPGTRNVYNYWYEVVRDYSGRQLTKQIDKFPALSGIALVMGSILKDTYLAGLWKNDFVWGLCWQGNQPWYHHHGQEPANASHGGYSQTKSKEWIAPSWSWASCNRCVSWTNRVAPSTTESYEERLTVQRVFTHTRGFDPYGVIDSASLVVIGKMKTAFIEIDFCFDKESGGCLGPVFFDDMITDVNQLENATIVERNVMGRGLVRFAEVFLLLVVTTGVDLGIKEPAGISRFYFNDFCLLLTRGKEENTYRRVGSLYTRSYVTSAEPSSVRSLEQTKKWSKDSVIRYPWFDDTKNKEVVVL